MTQIFQEIKQNKELTFNLSKHRPPGTEFDEILFADDTILLSENPKVLQELLREAETLGKKYGLIVNKDKTELLNINIKGASIRFMDGTKLIGKEEVIYGD